MSVRYRYTAGKDIKMNLKCIFFRKHFRKNVWATIQLYYFIYILLYYFCLENKEIMADDTTTTTMNVTPIGNVTTSDKKGNG